MGVKLFQYPIYVCTCDICGEQTEVPRNCRAKTYNAAQAVRSVGWSYGKDGKVLCHECRKLNRQDNYSMHRK